MQLDAMLPERTAGADEAAARRCPARGDGVCVLVNPGSGRQQGRATIGELEAALARILPRAETRLLRPGSSPADAAAAAIRDGYGTVAAAGGDGTVSSVASRLAGTDRRLGVIPLGTFNYFARGHGIPLDIPEAVAAIGSGTERRVDVGEVNGQVFLNNASIGVYATILAGREAVYRRFGRSQLAAHWSVLMSLLRLRKPLSLKVTADGEVRRVRTPLAFVANSAFQLREFGLDGAACVGDGRFALLLAPDCGRLDLLKNAVRLLGRSAIRDRDFELVCGSDILVETARSHRHVAWDGERSLMEAPFRFRVRPGALRLIAPNTGTAAR